MVKLPTAVPKPRSRRKKEPRPLKRGGRIARGKKKQWRRKPADAARIYGPKEFKTHVHASPCLGCGIHGHEAVDQAHFGKHPMGKKNDWTKTGPMCRPFTIRPNTHDHREDYSYPGCHARYDRRAKPFFTSEERAELERRQAEFYAEWWHGGAS